MDNETNRFKLNYITKIISDRNGISEDIVASILKQTFELIRELVMDNTSNIVEIFKFGRFYKGRTSPRTYIDRYTKEKRQSAARDSFKFKAR